MPITSIFDLIPNCPNPAPINVVPFFDGCNWSLIQIPAGSTCQDVLACLTNSPDFIGTLLTSTNGSIVITGHNIEVSQARLDSTINVSLGGPLWCDLTVWTTTVDLCSIFSNIGYTFMDTNMVSMNVGNGDTINIQGIDGMRFFVTPVNTLTVGLPTQRQHMQVLTRDDINHVAYWENNQCCAQTLSFDIATGILSLSGTNAVDLTSINTDNQVLALAGNILSISQLNAAPQAVDLTNVNEHTLGFVALTNILTIYGSDSIANDTVDLSQVDRHTLGIAWNILSIYDSTGALVNVVDLSNVNEHTLSFDVPTNMLSIIGSSGLPANNIVDLSLVNLHTLNLNGNLLEILNSDGTVNNTVNLAQVDQHTLQITGTRWCPAVTWDVQITIHDSTGAQSGPAISIPPPAVSCCDDVMACPGIQSMQDELAAHLITLAWLQNQIDTIMSLLP